MRTIAQYVLEHVSQLTTTPASINAYLAGALRQLQNEPGENVRWPINADTLCVTEKKLFGRIRTQPCSKTVILRHPESERKFVFLAPRPQLSNQYVYVVGDLHGDWDSFYKILMYFDQVGFVANRNMYVVFLGDYVDRGTMSLEVFLGCLGLRDMFGHRIILLRGNHEEEGACNGDFYNGQLRAMNLLQLVPSFNAIFEELPLYALAGRTLLVHGGPVLHSNRPTLAELLATLSLDDLDNRLIRPLWVDPVAAGGGRGMVFQYQGRGLPPLNMENTATFARLNSFLRVSQVIRAHRPKAGPAQARETRHLTTVFSSGNSTTSGYNAECQHPFIVGFNPDPRHTTDNTGFEFIDLTTI